MPTDWDPCPGKSAANVIAAFPFGYLFRLSWLSASFIDASQVEKRNSLGNPHLQEQ
jgi:hypothetical protein